MSSPRTSNEKDLSEKKVIPWTAKLKSLLPLKNEYIFKLGPKSARYLVFDCTYQDDQLKIFEIQNAFSSALCSYTARDIIDKEINSKFFSKDKITEAFNHKQDDINASFFSTLIQDEDHTLISRLGLFWNTPPSLNTLNTNCRRLLKDLFKDGHVIYVVRDIFNYHFINYNFCNHKDNAEYLTIAKHNQSMILQDILKSKVLQRLFFMNNKDLQKFAPDKLMLISEEDIPKTKEEIDQLSRKIIKYFGEKSHIIIKGNSGTNGACNAFFYTYDSDSIRKFLKKTLKEYSLCIIESVCNFGKSENNKTIYRTERVMSATKFKEKSSTLRMLEAWETTGEIPNSHGHAITEYYAERIKEKHHGEKLESTPIPEDIAEKHINIKKFSPKKYASIKKVFDGLEKINFGKVFHETPIFLDDEKFNAAKHPIIYYSSASKTRTQKLLDHIFIHINETQLEFNRRKKHIVTIYDKLEKNRNWELALTAVSELAELVLDESITSDYFTELLNDVMQVDAEESDKAACSIFTRSVRKNSF